MPPLPSSSIIWYLPAKVEPVVNSSVGVSRVFVAEISSGQGRGVAHSLQNLESEGFSELHLGHFITHHPCSLSLQKNNKE
ncbi:hypothetical protein ES703_93141 [subsurface metagenome]